MAEKEMGMKKAILTRFGWFLGLMLALAGCSMRVVNPMEKIKDVEYTVMTKENIPKEVLEEIEKRKEKEFRITFRDGENLYVCVGYGEKNRGGFSVVVKEFYEALNGIYVETQLVVPTKENPADRATPTYPYLVIKTEYQEKPVVFL